MAATRDPWARLAVVGLVVLAVVIVATFRGYGLSWDEEHSAENGGYAIAWFRSFGHDDRVITAFHQKLYGSLFNLAVQLTAWVIPLGLYETDHLLSAATGWLAVLSTYLIGRHLGGARCGFFAALVLALTPPFYGHMFMNPKDVPFAGLFAAAMYALVRADDALPSPSRRTLVVFGLLAGCAMGVRVAGMFVLGYWALALGAWWIGEVAAGRPRPAWWRLLGWWALPAGIAWTVMVAFWPYAQLDPFRHPFEAFVENAKFPWRGSMRFAGQTVSSMQLPATYLPTWFAISLPELYAIGLAAGVVPAIAFIAGEGRGRRYPALRRAALVMLAFVFPVAAAVWTRAVLYDGMRHFLFTVPFLALVVGWGLSAAWADAAALRTRRNPVAVVRGIVGGVAVGLALVSAALTVGDLVSLHPYEYVYFNRMVAGGQAAGAARFETDYWGLSYREALDWVRDHYTPATPGPVRLENCSQEFLTRYWIGRDPALRERFVSVAPHASGQILLATTRYNCHLRPGKVLHVVERKGVPLCYVIERTSETAPASPSRDRPASGAPIAPPGGVAESG